MTTAIKSISVSLEFVELAKNHKISWSEAAKVGVAIMLAERGVEEYDNKLNLFRKMTFFKQEFEKLSQQANEIPGQKN